MWPAVGLLNMICLDLHMNAIYAPVDPIHNNFPVDVIFSLSFDLKVSLMISFFLSLY